MIFDSNEKYDHLDVHAGTKEEREKKKQPK